MTAEPTDKVDVDWSHAQARAQGGDGALAEIILDGRKVVDSAIQGAGARRRAVLLSVGLQDGAPLNTTWRALVKLRGGAGAGLVGALLAAPPENKKATALLGTAAGNVLANRKANVPFPVGLGKQAPPGYASDG